MSHVIAQSGPPLTPEMISPMLPRPHFSHRLQQGADVAILVPALEEFHRRPTPGEKQVGDHDPGPYIHHAFNNPQWQRVCGPGE